MTDADVTIGRLQRKLAREKSARIQAENLLESKSLELYRAQEEANAARQEMLNAITAMRDGFAILDTHGIIVMCNPAFLAMMKKENQDISGQTARSLMKNLQPVSKKKTPDGATEYQLTDGRILQMHHNISQDGLHIVTVLDLTHRFNMEQRMAAAHKQEALGTLAGGIAHEINTPAQYVTSNLGFLVDALGDMQTAIDSLLPLVPDIDERSRIIETHDLDFLREEAPQAGRQAKDGITQISRIVSAVRHYSHPGKEMQDHVNLADVIDSALTVSQNQWKYVANTRVDVAEDMPEITANPDSLRQVILNLVVNAAQAIEESANETDQHINLTATSSSSHIQLIIEDSGPGIPDKTGNRVFDPFFTTKDPGKGTGQGLAITQRIICEEHAGDIRLDKSPLGGARFSITLPRSQYAN